VGLNLVMPEDWYVPMHDFHLHMTMMDYLHRIYPRVHISLHAGELGEGMVPPEGLSFHIRDSVETGHAERIGHGVDVMHETDPIALLKEMARRNVLVEICLTSNDVILGVRGDVHPLPIYRKYGVPVALATDDEGVSRSDMTHEYLRAAETYNFTYPQLKDIARASLEHSFLPGASLWEDGLTFRLVGACAADSPAKDSLSPACRKFLSGSPRAQVQWREEGEFDKFEAKF
jgi:adenosine deaminase